MESTLMFTNWGADKDNVSHVPYGILLNHKKEWDLVFYIQMVATRNYYCVVKEASLKKKTSRFPSSVITNTEYRNTIYIPETDILRYDQALQLLPALLRNRFLFFTFYLLCAYSYA